MPGESWCAFNNVDKKPGAIALPPLPPGQSGPLYQQVVDALIEAIEQRLLTQGQQLPSFNALARHYRVNPASVSRAITELEARGLVRRHYSTYYVRGACAEPERSERHSCR